MKRKLNILVLIVLFISCSDAKSNKEQSTPDNRQAPEDNQESTTSKPKAASGNPIVGDWYQEYAVIDNNGNALLDQEEKGGTKSTMGFNYFRFNDDGSCLYDSDVKFRGTYETFEENGMKKLNVTVNGFGETYKHTIEDLTADELVLYSSGVFMIFKRK